MKKYRDKTPLLSVEPFSKMLSPTVAVPLAPVRVPNQRPLAPSDTSVTSVANNKVHHEKIPGTVHRSPRICLRAEKIAGNLPLGDPLMKRLCDQSSPQTSSFPKNEADSTAQRVSRGKERQKERTGWNN